MSDPYNPAAPAAKTRPGSVTISSYLLLVVALVFALAAVAALATLGTVREVYSDAFAGTSSEGFEGIVTVAVVIGSVVQLLFAAAFVALALLNNRGRNAARITTWVVGGLGLCCVGFSFGSMALNGLDTGSAGGDAPSAAELTERLNAEVGWLTPFTTVSNIVALLALLAAMVLLALPPSNEYFRKPQAAWEPPVPGAAYPGHPQGPQGTDPGYPQSGAPGYPPAPPQGGEPGDQPGQPR